MILLLGLACTGAQYDYAGFNMVDHFPLDGDRAWIYSNPDLPYQLTVELTAQVETVGSAEVRTFEYYSEANGSLLMSLRVSSDSINGVLIHGYEVLDVDAGGQDSGEPAVGAWRPAESVTFDPPLVLAEDRMEPGETTETVTGGLTYTTTFVGKEFCANDWVSGANAWECLHIRIDDGDGDISTGSLVAGEYWMATRYGLSWFRFSGDTDNWILGRADWAP